MIRTLVAGLLFSLVAFGQQNRPPQVKSPEVNPDNTVTFRLYGPEATDVKLNASWAGGTKPMTKDEQGIWSVTVGPVEPDVYNYGYTINGVRTIDPHNAYVKTGIRGTSSAVEVPAKEPAVYDPQNVPHGELTIHHYYSKSLNEGRRLHVYTPPGYDKSNKNYPVLYLLHGAGDDDSGWYSIGRANFIMDNLIASGKAVPMIVVMPFGHTSAGRSGGSDPFVIDLMGDVLPLIESTYRVKKDPDSRAIAGLSMGGRQTVQVAFSNPGKFAWVASFSGAVREYPKQKFVQDFVANSDRANKQLKLLWIGIGKEDSLLESNKEFIAYLNENRIEHIWQLTEGDHSWPVWRRYLAEVVPQLFQSDSKMKSTTATRPRAGE